MSKGGGEENQKVEMGREGWDLKPEMLKAGINSEDAKTRRRESRAESRNGAEREET